MANATTTTRPAPPPEPDPEKPKTASQMIREKAQELMLDPSLVDRAAAALAMRNAKWGKDHGLSQEDFRAMEHVAHNAGLSIALGDIIILGGNMYVTLAGHLKFAHASEKFQGFVEDCLPQDQWDAWGIPKDSIFAWKAQTTRLGIDIPFIEIGWSGPSRDGSQPVAKTFPGEMARKRARARVLSLAFPIGIPNVEEVTRGEEIPEHILKAGMATISQPRRASERMEPVENAAKLARGPALAAALPDNIAAVEEVIPSDALREEIKRADAAEAAKIELETENLFGRE